MRMHIVVACFAALGCGSCSAVHRNDLAAQAAARDQVKPVYRQPAGYYAGQTERLFTDDQFTAWNAWVARNQRGIDEIQRRITQIRSGERRPGCFAEDKFSCVATIAQKLAVADNYEHVDDNLFAEVKYDVNGKPLNGAKIRFQGYPPNAAPPTDRPATLAEDIVGDMEARQGGTEFILNLGPQSTVVSMLARLPYLAPLARTQQDYDKTGVYEVVWAASVKTCPALQPNEVARWVENAIKPNSHISAKERLNDDVMVQELVSNVASFCGHKYVFHNIKKKEREGLGHTTMSETIVAIDWDGQANSRGPDATHTQKFF
jgi:hypothetical protein